LELVEDVMDKDKKKPKGKSAVKVKDLPTKSGEDVKGGGAKDAGHKGEIDVLS
jgi:hypothetical protein